MRSLSRILSLTTVSTAVGLAQPQLDPALLGKPPVDAWPTYHGDYSGRHYSTLSQINQTNVKNLGLPGSIAPTPTRREPRQADPFRSPCRSASAPGLWPEVC